MNEVMEIASRPSKPAWWLAPVAILLFSIFSFAEPLRLGFSASNTFTFADPEETIFDRIESNITAHEEGKIGRKVGMLVLAAFGTVIFMRQIGQRFVMDSGLAWLLAIFLVWTGVTVMWSVTPLLTIKRLIVLYSLAIGAAGIAKLCTLEQIARLTMYVTGGINAIGFCCECGLGTFRPWEPEYRFAGLTWPAFSCWLLSLFLLSVLFCNRQKPLRGFRSILCAAVILILLTKTRAGAAALVLGMMLYGSAYWTFATQLSVVVFGSFAIGVGLLTAAFAEVDLNNMLFGAVNMGRSEKINDVSGRAGVWMALVPYIARRPLHGYGYESFWTPEHLLAIGEDNWGAPDAHNAYINLALGGGLIASLLFIAILITGIVRARWLFTLTGRPGYLFGACVIAVTMVNSLCVATALGPYFMSFTYMMVLASVAFIPPPILPSSDRNLSLEDDGVVDDALDEFEPAQPVETLPEDAPAQGVPQ